MWGFYDTANPSDLPRGSFSCFVLPSGLCVNPLQHYNVTQKTQKGKEEEEKKKNRVGGDFYKDNRVFLAECVWVTEGCLAVTVHDAASSLTYVVTISSVFL